MPIIAVFFGIVVRMFYKEHEPAHFHAEHQSQQAKFDFSGKLLAGSIQSRTALRLIRQGAVLHRGELDANWAKMKAGQPLDKIAPLDGGSAMTFLPSVVRARYIRGFRIHLTFNDASEATVNFQQWLNGPVFEPLKSTTYFRKFFVEGGAVVWPNGADVAPEALYDAAQATRANKRMEPARAGSRSRAAHS